MSEFINDIKDALGLGDEFVPEDSWENRIATAAYTPPSGLRITFDFENLSRVIVKKTTAFDFPDADGQLIQDHGVGERRFPMRVYFWGADCDKQADVFTAALSEKGRGNLETPLYGEHTVVPFGEITRRDDLKTAANQVIFDVVFFRDIGVIYPSVQEDAASAVLSALELFGEAGAAEFATSLDQGSVSLNQSIIDDINDLINQVQNQLDKVAAVQDVVNDAFQDAVDTINNGIDTFIQQPLMLAWELQNMIQLPGTALGNINDRLEGYSNLAGNIFNSSDSIAGPGGPGGGGPRIGSDTGVGNDAQEPNKFHVRDLFASNYVASSVLSTLYTDTGRGGANSIAAVQQRRANAAENDIAASNKFITAADALTAAEDVLNQFDALVAWRDANYDSMAGDDDSYLSTPGNVDYGGAIQALQQAVGLGAGFLIQMSFSLLNEKTLELPSKRTIIDLCWELYGTIDNNTLDFFIDSNNLSGDEILELPMGKKVVYYV